MYRIQDSGYHWDGKGDMTWKLFRYILCFVLNLVMGIYVFIVLLFKNYTYILYAPSSMMF